MCLREMKPGQFREKTLLPSQVYCFPSTPSLLPLHLYLLHPYCTHSLSSSNPQSPPYLHLSSISLPSSLLSILLHATHTFLQSLLHPLLLDPHQEASLFPEGPLPARPKLRGAIQVQLQWKSPFIAFPVAWFGAVKVA